MEYDISPSLRLRFFKNTSDIEELKYGNRFTTYLVYLAYTLLDGGASSNDRQA